MKIIKTINDLQIFFSNNNTDSNSIEEIKSVSFAKNISSFFSFMTNFLIFFAKKFKDFDTYDTNLITKLFLDKENNFFDEKNLKFSELTIKDLLLKGLISENCEDNFELNFLEILKIFTKSFKEKEVFTKGKFEAKKTEEFNYKNLLSLIIKLDHFCTFDFISSFENLENYLKNFYLRFLNFFEGDMDIDFSRKFTNKENENIFDFLVEFISDNKTEINSMYKCIDIFYVILEILYIQIFDSDIFKVLIKQKITMRTEAINQLESIKFKAKTKGKVETENSNKNESYSDRKNSSIAEIVIKTNLIYEDLILTDNRIYSDKNFVINVK